MSGFFLSHRRRISVVGLIQIACVSFTLAQPAAPEKTLLTRYCVGCHSEQTKTAGIVLENVNLDRAGENAKLLEKVLGKVRTGEMPPRGLPRPEPAAANAFTVSLDA